MLATETASFPLGLRPGFVTVSACVAGVSVGTAPKSKLETVNAAIGETTSVGVARRSPPGVAATSSVPEVVPIAASSATARDILMVRLAPPASVAPSQSPVTSSKGCALGVTRMTPVVAPPALCRSNASIAVWPWVTATVDDEIAVMTRLDGATLPCSSTDADSVVSAKTRPAAASGPARRW